MNKSRKQLSVYIDKISLFVIGLFLLALPVFFLAVTTDPFVLPKQILLIGATVLLVVLFAIKTINEGRLRLRNSPFDLPVVLFVVIAFASAFLSANRFDGFIAFVPLFFLTVLYFAVVNTVEHEKQLLFIIGSLVLGATLASIVAILSFFKVYPLPMTYTHVPNFTTFGSLLDQAIYFALVLPIAGYFVFAVVSFLSKRERGSSFLSVKAFHPSGGLNRSAILFLAGFGVILIALSLTVYMLLTTQKPLILPFDVGIQTGFAAISQDSGNVLKSFALGSGIGTYLTDFTRFKPAAYNANPTLWSFVFFRSSSYVLEILATLGLLGLAVFLFLFYKVIRAGHLFLPVVLALIAAILLPFSFTLVILLFVLLSVFAVVLVQGNPDKYNESDFYLVGLRRGLFVLKPEGERVQQNAVEKRYNTILPIIFFLIIIAIVGIPAYFATRFVISDISFQKSLVFASQNNGLETYNHQISAINMFPYRDVYHRAFSQTNLALASSLADNLRSKENPTQEDQQNVLTLIQQSINYGRNSVTVAPITAFNWNHLSTVYRNLIGFGENADRFTILTAQQAIALDPNNPQQYVELGGVYYQLQNYDEAIRQFQVAINLKRDYANAYYNLGHAYESKGDLQTALTIYQTVKALVQKDPTNSKKISEEIDSISARIGGAANNTNVTAPSDADQQDLDVNDATNQLPERDPKAEIPEPTPFRRPSTGAAANPPTDN